MVDKKDIPQITHWEHKPIFLIITAPHFKAGIEIGGSSAPILSWMNRRGWTYNEIKKYCEQKGWTIEELPYID